MRFSLQWALAATAYAALVAAAIGQRSTLCATVLLAIAIVAFCYALIWALFSRGKSQARASQWGAIGSLSSAFICLTYWVVSSHSHAADFELSLHQLAPMQMSASDGSLRFCNSLGNLEVIELVEKSVPIEPAPDKRYGWTLPGLRFRYITFVGRDDPLWLFKFSLLIPAALATLLAAFCLRRNRQVLRTAPRVTAPRETWPSDE